MMFKNTLMTLAVAGAAAAIGGDFQDVLNGPAKDDKIAIIGGGLSGVHMAKKLHDLGYERIVVYESDFELGGKTKSFSGRDGVPDDIGLDTGAVYIPGSSAYSAFHELLEETGFDDELRTVDTAAIVDPFVASILQVPIDTALHFSNWISVRAIATSSPADQAFFGNGYAQFCAANAAAGCSPALPLDGTNPFYAGYGQAYFAGSLTAYGVALNVLLGQDARYQTYSIPTYSEATAETLQMSVAEFLAADLTPQVQAIVASITAADPSIGFPVQVKSLSFMRPLFESYYLLQGYGTLEETNVFYGVSFITPQFVQLLGGRIAAAAAGVELPANQNVALVKSGVGAVVTGLAESLQEATERPVRFKVGRTVVNIKKKLGGRKQGKYMIKTKRRFNRNGKRKAQTKIKVNYADFVISAIDQRIFSQLLRNVDDTQAAITGATSCLSSKAWRVSDATVTVPEYVTGTSIYSWSQANDFLRDLGVPLPPRSSNVAAVDQVSIKTGNSDYTSATRNSVLYELGPTVEDVEDLTFTNLGVHINEVHESITYDYFPHSEDFSECNPWNVLPIQGQDNLWFIGSSVSFESIESVLDYNNLLIDTFQAGQAV